jgi:mannose/fructose-specific phosphotransferase system component IIA
MPESVGVVVVGHGRSASALLGAAEGIVGPVALEGVIAVDADLGETAELRARMCEAVVAADRGEGVLLIADMFGASPCSCGIRMASGHPLSVVAGLNLAMLLKLATLDRSALGPAELATACSESGRRAIAVSTPNTPNTSSTPSTMAQGPAPRTEPA